MITYLVITTLLNIGLGYALAIYLGHAPRRLGSETESAQSYSGSMPLVANRPTAARSITTTPAAARSPEAKSITPIAKAPEDGDLDRRSATEPEAGRTEADLLAGIEEFRNHLTRIKGQVLPADLVQSNLVQPKV